MEIRKLESGSIEINQIRTQRKKVGEKNRASKSYESENEVAISIKETYFIPRNKNKHYSKEK